eukprot:comp17005_c0_seq1/m.15678 comp17005_c0_seq1/g.15678  ORF comp17005_c0_seq1/g.15678 comp17005_c0_seq1/m.15678 type:complete len:384 (-) comp17005_c0_seq1:600-1751(-)
MAGNKVIGVPKEVKNHEYRVALTPAGADALVKAGHTVYVQKGAGVGSGIQDSDYEAIGAKILDTAGEVWAAADMIMKVKEPQPSEYPHIKAHHTVFTYFHFAADEELTHAMIASGATCVAYETVEGRNRNLPLLTPMSEVAGRMAIQEGARCLERPHGGRGVLLSGVPGTPPATVLVIGGGVVGYNSAKLAAGLGAQVYLLDTNMDRLRYLSEVMPANVVTIHSNQYNLRKLLADADLVVCAVLIPGTKAPKLIKREDLKLMKPGAVIVDVAIDQGGACETSHPTTHSDPVYVVDGINHYCVANIPGAVPVTSTMALTNVTLGYALELANKGWKKAAQDNPGLALGVNVVGGKVTYKPVADAFGLEYVPVEKALAEVQNIPAA